MKRNVITVDVDINLDEYYDDISDEDILELYKERFIEDEFDTDFLNRPLIKKLQKYYKKYSILYLSLEEKLLEELK